MSNTFLRRCASPAPLSLVVALLGVPAAATAQSTSSPDVVGSWRLESWTLADGIPRCSAEEGGPSGQLVYALDGHMSAQLGCAEIDVSDIDDLSPQELRRRLNRRHLSCYGAYTLDETAATVTHHVQGSSNLGFVGSDQVRLVVFEGNDRLVITSTGRGDRLVWLRN